MVLVASSRSARTALPREQNQPGRRLPQAAQPAGTGFATCFFRACTSAEISVSNIVLPISDANSERSLLLLAEPCDTQQRLKLGEKALGLPEKRLLFTPILREQRSLWM
jgi:hypothetical protein